MIVIPATSWTSAEVGPCAIFLDREVNVKKAVASSTVLSNMVPSELGGGHAFYFLGQFFI